MRMCDKKTAVKKNVMVYLDAEIFRIIKQQDVNFSHWVEDRILFSTPDEILPPRLQMKKEILKKGREGDTNEKID